MEKTETPREAARRLAAGAIRDGFAPLALHEYQHADGTPAYWRIRCKRADGAKWLRPMMLNGAGYELREPPAPEAGKPLYRLPELLAADPVLPVIIVEGENKADALAKLDPDGRHYVVTTSGGATSADGTDWTPCKGRSSVIHWPDNDKAGQGYADTVTGKLHALGCIVERVDVAALDLPKKGDAVDWLEANPKAAAVVLELPRVVSKPDTAASTEPEPLRRPTPPPESYPVAELGPILAPACEALRRVIQAPAAVCGGSLLAAASLAVQGLRDIELDGRSIPLSLWLLTVAESGERKSAVDTEAMRAARDHEKAGTEAYGEALDEYESVQAEHNAKREAAKADARKTKGRGLADSLRSLGPSPDEPLKPYVLAADFTAEGLAKMLRDGQPSIGAFTDEAALVFGGHGMTQETVRRTAATLSKLWDRGELDRIRSGDGITKLYGKRLALHLMAQPVIAEAALSDPVLRGQGFLARCLLAWPEGTAGTRLYRAESLQADPAMRRYRETLKALHERRLPVADGKRNELEPPSLTLTPEAFEAWRGVHDSIEAAMAPDKRYAVVKPWASKAPDQVLRMAGVLTAIEGGECIEHEVIERAAEVVLWHLSEALRLAGTAELSPETLNAEALLAWCHATGRRLLHSRAALQYGPNCIREAATFRAAMVVLESTGWASRIEGGAEVDGKHRRNVWDIRPEVE